MKSVKSVSHLQTLALGKGASARLGGVTMNSTAERIQPSPAKPSQPEPVKPVAAPTTPKPETRAPDLMPALLESVAAMGDYACQAQAAQDTNTRVLAEMGRVLEAIAKLPQPQPMQETAAKGWLLKVERDTRGLMTDIICTPRK